MAGFLAKIFNADKKHLKKVKALADVVETYKEKMAALTNEELQQKTPYFRQLLSEGKTLEDILPEAFATAREAAKRVLGQFPFHVQVMGAIVLHQGDVAEMKTGEGKTLTATMSVYLNALGGKGVHVVTVNEYLASRDAEWMGEIYRFLGLTVGTNLRELTKSEKRAAFNCDITYTTNSEVGFDYLRDNMAVKMEDRVLRGMNYAVIDEADSILIDESRTPLIISGGKRNTANLYQVADRFAKSLTKDTHFEIDEKHKSIFLKEEGVKLAERGFNLENLYDIRHAELVHYIQQALKANYTMARDVEYMVDNKEVQIIDSFTGRILKGREYSDGLHQAIQAKEGVPIKEETVTMATITYQNLFRMYDKLSGMTGTAKTEEEEFHNIYNMRVICIPTNLPVVRVDEPDLIFLTKGEKLDALTAEVKRRHELGQPVLVGTVAVESSEEISQYLTKAGLKHQLLNAKNHEREAHIIAEAGCRGAITLATNMAGRGTDIKLSDEVKALGGLVVLGSERHEARRIDNQLRGRSGRQGDPGYSRFFISFEDDLLRRFGDGFIINTIKKGLKSGPAEIKQISKLVTNAQEQIEGYNFDIRKNLIGYDDVLRQQREVMYGQRDKVIEKEDVHDQANLMYRRFADSIINNNLRIENKENVADIDSINKFLTNFRVAYQVPDRYNNSNNSEIATAIEEGLWEIFESRRNLWGDEIFKQVERHILLKVIDDNWQKHIDKMSKLREGIHLRSYAQSNPLQSYIDEGFKKFNELGDKIAEDFVNFSLHVKVTIRKPEENTENKAIENGQPEEEQLPPPPPSMQKKDAKDFMSDDDRRKMQRKR